MDMLLAAAAQLRPPTSASAFEVTSLTRGSGPLGWLRFTSKHLAVASTL
jgi:hypothetical protein